MIWRIEGKRQSHLNPFTSYRINWIDWAQTSKFQMLGELDKNLLRTWTWALQLSVIVNCASSSPYRQWNVLESLSLQRLEVRNKIIDGFTNLNLNEYVCMIGSPSLMIFVSVSQFHLFLHKRIWRPVAWMLNISFRPSHSHSARHVSGVWQCLRWRWRV